MIMTIKGSPDCSREWWGSGWLEHAWAERTGSVSWAELEVEMIDLAGKQAGGDPGTQQILD